MPVSIATPLGSRMSLSIWFGIVVTEFRFPRLGLTIGDCLTDRLFLVFDAGAFLVGFFASRELLVGAE